MLRVGTLSATFDSGLLWPEPLIQLKPSLEKFIIYGFAQGRRPVSFATYTGQENEEKKQAIWNEPRCSGQDLRATFQSLTLRK